MSEVAGRVLDLLDQAITADEPMGMLELAANAGVDKSTASRMLRFLVERQLLVRSPETQRYDVGPAFLMLAAAAMKRSQLNVAAQRHLEALRDETGETVCLHLRMGADRICMYGVESRQDIRSAITPSERRPLYQGASGKAILAYLTEADRRPVLRQAKTAGVDVKSLERELATVSKQHFRCEISSRVAGLAALAVPVFDAGGVIASITISGPVGRWGLKRMRSFAGLASTASGDISLALGGVVAGSFGKAGLRP